MSELYDPEMQMLVEVWERANNTVVRVAELPLPVRERLQAMVEMLPLYKLLGIEIVEQGPSLAVIQMPLRKDVLNENGTLHGGAIATFIDIAAGMAASRGGSFDPAKDVIVTADLHVRYLRRPRGNKFCARAHVIDFGRRSTTVDCRVTDQESRIIAVADVSLMVRSREPLTEESPSSPAPASDS